MTKIRLLKINPMKKLKSILKTDEFLIRGGIVVFAACIIAGYTLHPQWVTFSHLALQLYTLPFFLVAMAITVFLLVHTGKRLRSKELHVAGIAMYLSAFCMSMVVLIPYRGDGMQIAFHNAAALLFVLCAATGLAWLARRLRDFMLMASSGLQVGICALELIMIAVYDSHPAQPWMWVVLQVMVTLLLLLSLLRVFSLLQERNGTRGAVRL